MREYRSGEMPCMYGVNCLGKTFVSYEQLCFGRVLPRFVTPNNASFGDRCVLCLRRDVTREYYRVLYDNETPQCTIIHPYTVYVDAKDQYDADSCLFPPTWESRATSRFIGVIGPFPRFDSMTLVVKPDRIEQRAVKYNILPTILHKSRRQGARRIDFFYNISSALILAGFVCEVNIDSNDIEVINALRDSIPRRNNHKIVLQQFKDEKTQEWLMELVDFTYSTAYPHVSSVSRAPDLNELTLCVQEHVVFLVEHDELMSEAVHRRFPKWMEFANFVKSQCNALRSGRGINTRTNRVYLYPTTNTTLNRLMKREWPAYPFPTSVPEVYNRLKRRPNIDSEIALLSDQDRIQFEWYVGGVIQQHMYLSVRLPNNKQIEKQLAYVCSECFGLKSSSEKNYKFGGHSMLSMEWNSRNLFCATKDLTGRRPILNEIERQKNEGIVDIRIVPKKMSCVKPLRAVVLGTHISHINGECKTVCRKCRTIIDFSMHQILYDTLCKYCSVEVEEISCAYCGSVRPKLSKCEWMQVKAFSDGGVSGCKTFWFCKNHSFQCTQRVKYWCLPLLMDKVNSIFIKKTTKKMRM